MADIVTTIKLSRPNKQMRSFVGLLVVLGICISAQSARAGHAGGVIGSSSRTSTYVFVVDQSTLVQTGGFAGVHETYAVEGTLRLSVDSDSGAASFSHVEAKLTGMNGFLDGQGLEVVFNMGQLQGTIAGADTIKFEGKASDGTESDVVITLSFEDDSIRLTGATVPPANSADFFVLNLDAVAQKKYGGGTGEPDDPYLIFTAEQMNAIGADPGDWDMHFRLNGDIDLGGIAAGGFNIIGASEDNPFTGEFDGNGYRVSNFNYTSAGGDYVGLFGCVGWDGVVRDLKLIDAIVEASKGDYVAPLAGCLAGGTVVNCSAEGSIVSGNRYVGGLVGRSTATSGGDLEILAVGSIEGSCAGGSISGDQDVGGLIGANSGLISNCYSSANVSGTSGVGGLVGSNNQGHGPAEISTCYAIGIVGGTARVGGLAGQNNSEILNCFWDVQTSGQTASDGGNGRTTAQMQTPGTFLDAGWDLVGESANGTEDIWRVCEAADYPHLTRQIQAGDFVCPDGITAEDFLFFAQRWLNENCDMSNHYCQGTDLDFSGAVDADDLAIFLDIWLANP